MKKLIVALCFLPITTGYSQNTFPSSGNVGIGTTSPGSSALKIEDSTSDFVDFGFATSGTGHLQFIGWQNGWNLNAKTDGKHLYINRDAGANSNVVIGRREGKELFVRGNDGYVGFGTSQPSHPFHLKHDWAVMSLDTNSDGQDAGIRLQENGVSRWHMYNDAGSGDVFRITRDGGNTTGKVDINTNLDVSGTIRSQEIIVENGWADFVFEPEYNLRSLDEVESHIVEHGHLPDVPSAETVQSEGLSVGKAQAIMMQKIEELTLYMIEQEKRISTLELENQALRSSIRDLD